MANVDSVILSRIKARKGHYGLNYQFDFFTFRETMLSKSDDVTNAYLAVQDALSAAIQKETEKDWLVNFTDEKPTLDLADSVYVRTALESPINYPAQVFDGFFVNNLTLVDSIRPIALVGLIKNLKEMLQQLGIKQPKMALVTSTGAVKSARLARVVTDYFSNLEDATVFGPITIERAISQAVVQSEQYLAPIAGDADLLVLLPVTAEHNQKLAVQREDVTPDKKSDRRSR